MAVNFESSQGKKFLREEKQKARQDVIDRTKAKYDKARWKEEQAKKRGEDTWMLPSISDRIDKEEKEHAKSKKKKHKKEKKHNKSKKSKKHKHSDSEEEQEWTESVSTSTEGMQGEKSLTDHHIGPKLERDSWMDAPPDFLPTISRNEIRIQKQKELEEERKKLVLEPGKHPKELNPFWKDGGSGLPSNEIKATPDIAKNVAGDAGYSWLKKAYDRCVQQAKEDGKTLEEIAADRYGSLEELESKIAHAKRKQEASSESRHGRTFYQPGTSRPGRDNRDYTSQRRGDPTKERYLSRDDKEVMSERDDLRHKYSRKDDNYDNKASLREEVPTGRHKSRSFMRPSGDDNFHSDRTDRTFRKPRSEDVCSSRSEEHGRDSRTDRKKMSFRKPESDGYDSQYVSKTTSSAGKKDDSARWKKKPDRQETLKDDQSPRITEHQSPPVEQTYVEYSESSSSASESFESEDEVGTSTDQVELLSELEMNEIGAKIVKAEIMGDEALAKQLKDRIASARKAMTAKPQSAQNKVKRKGKIENDDEGDEDVLLTRTDRTGMTRPLPARQFPIEPKGGRRKKQKIVTHGDTGERQSYFDDDDKYDLKTLVERERMGTAEDSNMMFARLAGRSIEKTDEEHQVDDVFMQRASKKQSDSKQEDREKHMAVQEHKKTTAALEKCKYCFENVAKHLIVAIGRKVYLSLPSHKSMAEGHCLIVPMQHVAQSTVVDEDVWDEIQAFRRCLTQMFQERDEDCVFMETSMALYKMPHMAIECVPMPREIGDMAPIYYKKALMESESEWAQNKKVIDLSQKNIKNAIPKGFPYFSVDFGLQGGFAHVIEDEKTFPWYFGREVCGGMMDLDPTFWRKPHKESFDSSRRKVLEFEKMWKPHDWTLSLKSVR